MKRPRAVTEEARALLQWLQVEHPDKSAAARTIENAIRYEYRDRE